MWRDRPYWPEEEPKEQPTKMKRMIFPIIQIILGLITMISGWVLLMGAAIEIGKLIYKK